MGIVLVSHYILVQQESPQLYFHIASRIKDKLSLTSLVVVNVHSPVESGHTCAFKPNKVKIAI